MGDITIEERDTFEALREEPDNSHHAAVIDYPWTFDVENGKGLYGYDREDPDSGPYQMEEDVRLAEILVEVARVCVPGAWVFVFADDEVYPLFRQLVEDEEGLIRRRTIYWDSVDWGMGYYHRVQAYPLVTATVGDTDRYVQDRPNIYRAKHHSSNAEYHTQKPAELYRQMLEPPVLEDGEALLEPFCGTAPGKSVALERGCSYTGWDVSEEALRLAGKRTGRATL